LLIDPFVSELFLHLTLTIPNVASNDSANGSSRYYEIGNGKVGQLSMFSGHSANKKQWQDGHTEGNKKDLSECERTRSAQLFFGGDGRKKMKVSTRKKKRAWGALVRCMAVRTLRATGSGALRKLPTAPRMANEIPPNSAEVTSCRKEQAGGASGGEAICPKMKKEEKEKKRRLVESDKSTPQQHGIVT